VRPAAAAAITLLRGRCGGPLVSGPVRVTASGGREVARAALATALGSELAAAENAGTVVHLVGYGDDPADLNPAAAVTVVMDKPDLLAHSSSPALIATYSSSPASMSALADVLTGRAAPTGRSPVAVPGLPRTACR
ncbi:glycoside hydrolase family 3, partial [Actinoplanes sp. NPDC051633]